MIFFNISGYKIDNYYQENICDVHASCTYDENVGKSICKCDKRYEGDGKVCHLAPECREDAHCTENSHCDDGICLCNKGFERDISDLYVEKYF